jgi:hypothetical protein
MAPSAAPIETYDTDFIAGHSGKFCTSRRFLEASLNTVRPLNSVMKMAKCGFRSSLAGMVIVASLALSGCISATGPILSDAKALLGERGEIHIFSPRETGRGAHSVATFRWNGSRYIMGGRSIGVSDFTVHTWEGRDLVVQSRSSRAPYRTEYALARKLADRVYMVQPISEDDADDAARQRFCTKTTDASCRISTPEQLFVFARATAEKELESGGIAVIVPSKAR